MLFNTFHFWVFFAVTTLAFFTLPRRTQPWLMLVASYFFYMCWEPAYGLLIAASTAISYISAWWIAHTPSAVLRRWYLALGLIGNFGILFFFKYANFFSKSLEAALAAGNVFVDIQDVNLELPVGISFFTFQAASYNLDVFFRTTKVEKNPGIYALFVSFYPQLVAGPIERSNRLLPQFLYPKSFDYGRLCDGLRLALWGLFKKVCIADLLATPVNTVYAEPGDFSGGMLLLATVFFAVQIYCDFSGYSDIAIGVARVLGFELMTNFRQPYFATSVGDFWRRWHISLSTWFRDYLYLPLGGNRVSLVPWIRNVMLVFTVSGLWHGAAWTFVIWGALHGFYLVVGRLTEQLRGRFADAIGLTKLPRLHHAVKLLIVFVLVLIAWVFFRAATFEDAMYVVTHMFDVRSFRIYELWKLGLPRFEVMLCFAMTAALMVIDGFLFHQPPVIERLWSVRPFRWACYTSLIYAIVFFGVLGEVQFIYFQF